LGQSKMGQTRTEDECGETDTESWEHKHIQKRRPKLRLRNSVKSNCEEPSGS